jgi:hypothetical protein
VMVFRATSAAAMDEEPGQGTPASSVAPLSIERCGRSASPSKRSAGGSREARGFFARCGYRSRSDRCDERHGRLIHETLPQATHGPLTGMPLRRP